MKTDAVLRLTLKEGKLILGEGRGRELVPIGPGHFLIEGGSEYFFEGGGEKRPLVIRQTAEGYPPSFYTRVEPAKPTLQKLAEYEGKYWSDELEVFYIVAIKDGKLTIRHRPEPAAALEPTYEDGFLVGGRSGGTVIRFTRDKKGHVNGLSAYSGRVRHLKFFRK